MQEYRHEISDTEVGPDRHIFVFRIQRCISSVKFYLHLCRITIQYFGSVAFCSVDIQISDRNGIAGLFTLSCYEG